MCQIVKKTVNTSILLANHYVIALYVTVHHVAEGYHQPQYTSLIKCFLKLF